MNTVYLMLGSNLGDRQGNLKLARERIQEEIGFLTVISGIYESEPWGFRHETDFLNQCLIIGSDLQAEEILSRVRGIEASLGRDHNPGTYAARVIDIDILFFNDETINQPGLIVPHQALHLRRFVLVPLAEISPDLEHPELCKSISELLEDCPDPLSVRPFLLSW